MPLSDVDPEIGRQLQQLEKRRRYLKNLAISCGLAAVCAAVLSFFAAPDNVFIPDALLQSFPEIGYQEEFRTKGFALIGMIGKWAAPFLGLLGLGWLAARLLKKDTSRWREVLKFFGSLFAFLVLTIVFYHMAVPMYLRWSGNIDISRTTFQASIQRSNYADAHRWMINNRVLGRNGSRFVLAQLAVQEELNFPIDYWVSAAKDALEAEHVQGRGITEAYGGLAELAAVEKLAYGEVCTAAARNHETKHIGQKVSGFFIAAVAFVTLAIGFSRFSARCKRSLKNIRELLGVSTKPLPPGRNTNFYKEPTQRP